MGIMMSAEVDVAIEASKLDKAFAACKAVESLKDYLEYDTWIVREAGQPVEERITHVVVDGVPELLNGLGYEWEMQLTTLQVTGFNGDKYHSEHDDLWEALGPFVNGGSFINVTLDWDDRWRYWFTGTRCIQQDSITTYEGGDIRE